MADEQYRLSSVSLEGNDPNITRAIESLLRGANDPVELPAGRISKEALTEIAQENVGLAFNKKLEKLQAHDTPASVADKIADSIIELAHPTKTGTQVNVQINFSHASDDEILRRYYERMKDATPSTD